MPFFAVNRAAKPPPLANFTFRLSADVTSFVMIEMLYILYKFECRLSFVIFRQKGIVTKCDGGLPSDHALYSCPRAPSLVIKFGHVRRSPVGLIGSCAFTIILYFAAVSTTLSKFEFVNRANAAQAFCLFLVIIAQK